MRAVDGIYGYFSRIDECFVLKEAANAMVGRILRIRHKYLGMNDIVVFGGIRPTVASPPAASWY